MDIETIIYLIFFLIFIVSRIFKAKQKEKEKRQAPSDDPWEEKQLPREDKKKEPTFQDIFTDMMERMEEKEHHEEFPAREVKNVTPPYPEKQPKPEFITEEDKRRLLEMEGVSAFDKAKKARADSRPFAGDFSRTSKRDITRQSSLSKVEQDDGNGGFEFDPREAYMMKVLLKKKF